MKGAAWPLDRAVALVLLTRVVSLVAAPVTLWLVATQRPLAEQGPYFVFWNTQALTQLMELGIGGLIVQFASHESPGVAWGSRGQLDGDPSARVRLRNVLRQGRRWYGVVALGLLVVGGVGGSALFLSTTGQLEPHPLAPWLVTVVCTAAYLPLVPDLCLIEGSGGLIRVQRMRLAQIMIAMGLLWAVLLVWGALWAVAAFAAAWVAVAWGWLRYTHSELLRSARGEVPLDPEDNSPERVVDLTPVQWRTGTTWLAWWVAPQVLTPIVLATHGPAAAGQVGMTLAIAMAPLTLASAWLQGRYPRYGALISLGQPDELRRVASEATTQALVVCLAGTLAATVAVWLLGVWLPSLAARALPAIAITILGAANLAWLAAQSMASYRRAWREEPMTEATVIGAALVTVGTYAASTFTSAAGTVTAYTLLVCLGMLPVTAMGFARPNRRGARS